MAILETPQGEKEMDDDDMILTVDFLDRRMQKKVKVTKDQKRDRFIEDQMNRLEEKKRNPEVKEP